jgi:MraZ protein
MLFLGEYEHSLDSKQRLAIPSELRQVLNPATIGASFVAVPGPDALMLWPDATFERLASGMGGSLVGEQTMRQFERVLFSQAAAAPLDSAGRVRIPDRLLARYGLSGNIVILGVRDHLDLISAATWKAREAERHAASEDLWRRAHQILDSRSSSSK